MCDVTYSSNYIFIETVLNIPNLNVKTSGIARGIDKLKKKSPGDLLVFSSFRRKSGNTPEIISSSFTYIYLFILIYFAPVHSYFHLLNEGIVQNAGLLRRCKHCMERWQLVFISIKNSQKIIRLNEATFYKRSNC